MYDDDEDFDEDDPDVASHPISKLNLKDYLSGLLGEFVRQPFFQEHFMQHLNKEEIRTLQELQMGGNNAATAAGTA